MSLFMNLKSCSGGDPGEIFVKKRNIYLLADVNNKYFDQWTIANYVDWGLKYTKLKFAVVIADMPDVYKTMVRDRASYDLAFSKTIKQAEEYEKICKNIKKSLDSAEKKKFEVIRWSQVCLDPNYGHNLDLLLNQYEQNKEFANLVNSEARKTLTRLTDNMYGSEDVSLLVKGILKELPIILNGVTYKDKKMNVTNFTAGVYPGSLQNLVKLRTEPFFANAMVKMKLNSKLNATLELYVK